MCQTFKSHCREGLMQASKHVDKVILALQNKLIHFVNNVMTYLKVAGDKYERTMGEITKAKTLLFKLLNKVLKNVKVDETSPGTTIPKTKTAKIPKNAKTPKTAIKAMAKKLSAATSAGEKTSSITDTTPVTAAPSLPKKPKKRDLC
jgi:hypothetical protein